MSKGISRKLTAEYLKDIENVNIHRKVKEPVEKIIQELKNCGYTVVVGADTAGTSLWYAASAANPAYRFVTRKTQKELVAFIKRQNWTIQKIHRKAATWDNGKAEQMFKLREQGLTLRAIGLQMDPPMQTHAVNYYLEKYRKRNIDIPGGQTKMERILELRRRGLKLHEIGMQMDPPLSSHSVAYYLEKCKKNGWDISKNKQSSTNTELYPTPSKKRSKMKAERILELRRQGLSGHEIGLQMEPPISGNSVYYYLKKCKKEGYDVPQKIAHIQPKDIRDRAKAERILELRGQGLSMRDIGSRLEPPMSGQCVCEYLKKCKILGYDVPDIRVTRANKAPKQPDPDVVKSILDAWPADGRCYMQDIAKQTKASLNFVRQVRREYNLPLVTIAPHAKVLPDQQPAVKQAYESGTSVKELAKQYGVTTHAIYALFGRLKRKEQHE